MPSRHINKRALLAAVLILTLSQLIVIIDHAAGATVPRPPAKITRGTATAVDYGSGTWGGPGAVARYGDPATAAVLMVGDSITARCIPQLTAAFEARGKTLAVIAQSGQNTAGLATLIESELRIPADVVMEAGTNDVFDPFAMPTQVARVVQYVQDTGARLHWVDTYVGRPAYDVDDARNSGQVNGAIWAAAPHVISSVGALTAARGRGRALSYYLQDGVHYWTAAGTGHGDGCAFYAVTVAGGVA